VSESKPNAGSAFESGLSRNGWHINTARSTNKNTNLAEVAAVGNWPRERGEWMQPNQRATEQRPHTNHQQITDPPAGPMMLITSNNNWPHMLDLRLPSIISHIIAIKVITKEKRNKWGNGLGLELPSATYLLFHFAFSLPAIGHALCASQKIQRDRRMSGAKVPCSLGTNKYWFRLHWSRLQRLQHGWKVVNQSRFYNLVNCNGLL